MWVDLLKTGKAMSVQLSQTLVVPQETNIGQLTLERESQKDSNHVDVQAAQQCTKNLNDKFSQSQIYFQETQDMGQDSVLRQATVSLSSGSGYSWDHGQYIPGPCPP